MSTFKINFENLQPSQMYINQRKLSNANEWIKTVDANTIILPVIKINDRVTLTDGHSRALALYLQGIRDFIVEWDLDELDYRAYGRCVEWCESVSIKCISDLETKVISDEEFLELWINKCSEMHIELEKTE